jgi:ankyrin repeat protein
MRAAHAAIDARDAGLEARLHARFEGQLADLRAQVAALEARLEPTKPKTPTKPKNHDNTTLEPLSYDAAFDQLGGQAALDGFAARSKALLARTRDDALEKELADLQMTERRGFSTALVNQRFVEDLDELYDDARRAMPGFFATCQDLASKTQATFHAGAEKCSTRARMKALFKYKDETGVAYHRLTDVVRCTLSYTSLELLYDGFEKVLDVFGDDVKEAHDRYQQPLGDYRDIQLVVSHDNHLCELQLTTSLYMRAKATTGHRTFEVIRELKAAVADGDAARVDTALSWGHCSQLKDLLRTQASTLLAEASKKGHAGIVARLLRAGADANAPANDGETALHAAIRLGHERVVWALLDVGSADHSVACDRGACALTLGFALLRSSKEESRARAVATLARHAGAEAVRKARANVDQYIENHLWQNCRQLVEEAAEGDYKECVRLLTERWADPNSMTDSRSALTAACRNGHRDVVSLLLEHRAHINRPSKSGATPLYAACSGSHYELASFLLERGADPSLALPSAVRDGAVDVARYLLEQGAVIDDGIARQLTEGSFAPLDALLADPSDTKRMDLARDLVGMHPILHAHEGARPLVYDFKAGDLVVAKVAFKNVQVGDLGTVAEKPARDPSRVAVDFGPGKGIYNYGRGQMCVRAPLVPGFELVIGDQVTCLEKVDAAIPSHSRGTVIRHANEPPTEVIVRFKAGERSVDASRLAHAPLTTGSLMAKGDRVVAGVAFEQVRIGDTGMIVGPGSTSALDNAARRLLVDFGQQRCYNYTPSQLTYATESGSFSKEDKVVSARPHNGIPRGARGVVIGHTHDMLRVDFSGRCVLSRIGDLAHAPLVQGSDIRKGDRVAARVAYGSVQVNDLGTVVGSGDQKSQRVCVVWDRDGAKNNWLPGAQLAVVDAPPLSEGTP